MSLVDLLRMVFNLGPFRPAFYLYSGRFEYDRDIHISGWRGPFKSRTDAFNNVSSDWDFLGLDKPMIRFKLFQPYDCREPLEEKWTVKSKNNISEN